MSAFYCLNCYDVKIVKNMTHAFCKCGATSASLFDKDFMVWGSGYPLIGSQGEFLKILTSIMREKKDRRDNVKMRLHRLPDKSSPNE